MAADVVVVAYTFIVIVFQSKRTSRRDHLPESYGFIAFVQLCATGRLGMLLTLKIVSLKA